MLKLRSNELVDFEHYLQVRATVASIRPPARKYLRAMNGSIGLTLLLLIFHGNVEILAASAAAIPIFGVLWNRAPKSLPIDPDREMLLRADASAELFRNLLNSRKLRGSLHSGVAAVLNECASSWRRIVAVNENRIWKQAGISGTWNSARAEWNRAADLAMAEALVLAQSSITLRGPRPRVEEVIEEVIETFTTARVSSSDPLPPQFHDLREIADNLRQLSSEVERIGRTIQIEEPDRVQPSANQRLEDVLGRLREIKTAEEELEQHVQG